MKKRSAMLVAAGLVLAMVVAGLGFTMGLTGPTADAKKVTVGKASGKPIVHTTTKTITIHKKAETPSAGSSVVVAGSVLPVTSSAGSYGDDSYEHESADSSQESEDSSSSASSESGDD